MLELVCQRIGQGTLTWNDCAAPTFERPLLVNFYAAHNWPELAVRAHWHPRHKAVGSGSAR